MNAFYEHHKDNIKFRYGCFDRILLNACIQSFLDGAGVQGYFWVFVLLRWDQFEGLSFHLRATGARQIDEADKELVWRAEGFGQEYPPDVIENKQGYWLLVRGAELPPQELAGLGLQSHETILVRYGLRAANNN